MCWPAVGVRFHFVFLGEKLNVKDPVWPMTICKHTCLAVQLINLHIAMHLLPLVALPLPLQPWSCSRTASPVQKSARDVACKFHDKAAGSEARGRFTISKILEQACVLVIRGFQCCALPESLVSVVSGVYRICRICYQSQAPLCGVRCLCHNPADMMALSVVWSSLWCLLNVGQSQCPISLLKHRQSASSWLRPC